MESRRTQPPTHYPPIADYGVIGDGRTAALVSRDGSVDWLCLPDFSGRAIFSALLDQRQGGRFRIAPVDACHISRRYVGQSNVLETRFVTATGTATITDCLAMLPYAESEDILCPQSELLRRIEVHQGRVDLDVLYAPQPDFCRTPPHLDSRGSRALVLRDRHVYMVFQSEHPLRLHENRHAASARLSLSKGDVSFCSVAFVSQDMGVLPSLGKDAEARLENTRHWWQNWADHCQCDRRHRDAVVRSALTLKMLQHGLTGAVVAAPTTSLPEVLGGRRNWDYRYCWLRDAALTFQAFADLDHRAEGEQFLGWLLHATRLSRPRLRVLYDAYGETRIPERELDHLEGYAGSRPVRVGNAAANQLQLDVYGAIIQATADYVSRGGNLDRPEARLLRGFGHMIVSCWNEPDASIWEIRGERRHYTYSKMMCWSGLDLLLKLHGEGHLRLPRERFQAARDDIEEAIEHHGFSRACNSYVQTFGSEEPDASLLLAARHYRDPRHPRMAGTYDYVDRMLSRGPLVYRYRPGSDGMSGNEGAFVMTSFWAVEFLARAGRLEEAERRFAGLLECAGELGLYAEEIDPASGQALGNYPQAFSHLGLITAATALNQARRESESREEDS